MYKRQGKTVLLPCDDPEWSNFTRFFAQNFETLGLKKLISTSYARNSKIAKYNNAYHQISLFELQSPNYNETISESRGKIFTLERDKDNSGAIDFEDIEWQYPVSYTHLDVYKRQILNLTPLLERKPKALSGGEKQRVALGRAIVRQPKVFLMDEPLSNLDAKLQMCIRDRVSSAIKMN